LFHFKCTICLLMILMGGFTYSCQNQTQMADIILENGKVVTVDKNFSIHSAVAIRGDRFIAVGTDDEIKKYADDKTRIINVEGKTIIPGLIDAHAHPEAASLSELDEEIPDLHSVQELLEWIKQMASVKNEGEWIIHPKMFYTRLTDLRQPTLQELDQAASHNPVFLNGSFGGLVNTAAMEASGITAKQKKNVVMLDPNSGKPTGFIKASAFKLLNLPPEKKLSSQDEVDALKVMFRNYNHYGITGVVSGYGDLNNYNRYRKLNQNNELTVRITQNFLLPYDIRDSKERLLDSLKTFPLVTGEGNEWIRTGSLKVFLDGGILTGTAYLREPWGKTAQDIYDITDPEYRGVVNYTREDLLNIVSAANEAGWAFTAHITGGGGVDLLLDVYEEINQTTPINDKRFSIIHGNFFTDLAIDKMQKLSVIANVQPAWFYKDAVAMRYILGEERIKTFNPYQSMIEKGVTLSGGSDHMVKLDANTAINPYNPFLGMWSSITRKTERGAVVVPEEAVSREDALKMYTINNAYATFEDDLKGSIEPGKLADLVVLSNDILLCPVDQIKNIQSELTIVGGREVYSIK
jgi:predicted amidohydrolase YtcJ